MSETFMADTKWRYRAFYQFGRAILAGSLKAYTRTTVSGRDNIPADGPFILAPVHRSYVDTPITAGVTRRRLRFMGKESMWKIGWLGKVFSALGAFPVNRGSTDRQSLKRALGVLADGEGLVLFPEGERKQGPTVFEPMDGAVFLAVKAMVPIVPVGIAGSEWVMPKDAKFVYPRRVHVEIGPPIPPPTLGANGRIPRSAYTEMSAALRSELQRLFDIAMERVPASYPASDSIDGAPPTELAATDTETA